jgi:ribosome maturation factor RimP
MEKLLDRIKQVTVSDINSMGYEMVDLSLFKAQGRLMIRFLVDKPSGGITLSECALLNERLSGLLDEEEFIDQGYVLEVSSPGVDRALQEKNDFVRASGRKVRIFLGDPIEKKTEIDGIIGEVGDEFLSLKTDERIVKVPFNKIKKAKQVMR